MTMISDGKLDLEFKQDKSNVQVTLGADKYRLAELAEYELFLPGDEHYLPGKVLKANEDQLTLSYQLPEQALALTEYVKRFDRAAVLRLLPQLYWIVEEQGLLQPFIAPENLLLSVKGSLSYTGGSKLQWHLLKRQPNLESNNFGR